MFTKTTQSESHTVVASAKAPKLTDEEKIRLAKLREQAQVERPLVVK